jgi:putative SOS response-associated peptidase YedK
MTSCVRGGGKPMCGRVVQAKDPTLYTHVLGGEPERALPNTPPHYNGAPGQDYLIGRLNPKTGERSIDVLRWGLIPSWAKDRKIAWRMINARAETVQTAPAFKKAYSKRRALLPVDGFYEWKKVGKEKRPYLIGMADGAPFTLATLWENWKDPDSGEWVRTFTIVTTEANELVAELHDRMPVIIAEADRERWMADDNPADLLRPYPAELMTMWPVSQQVNSVKNDGPELLERIPGDESASGGVERVNEAARNEPANSE